MAHPLRAVPTSFNPINGKDITMQTKLTLNTKIKFLDAGRKAPYARRTTWAPPGTWMPRLHGLVMCKVGHHYTTLGHWTYYVENEAYVVETRGGKKVDKQTHKACAQEARLVEPLANWNQRTASLLLHSVVDELETAGLMPVSAAATIKTALGMASRGERITTGDKTDRALRRLWRRCTSPGAPTSLLNATETMVNTSTVPWYAVAGAVRAATQLLAQRDRLRNDGVTYAEANDNWRQHFAYTLIALVNGKA